ncbi:MAG: hypothetical protein ACI4U5_04125 [Bacilli bacterium]
MKKLSLLLITLSLITFTSCGDKETVSQKTELDIFKEQYKEKYPNGYTLSDGFYIIRKQIHLTRNSMLVKDYNSSFYGELSAVHCLQNSICGHSSSFRYDEAIYNNYREFYKCEYMVKDNQYTKKDTIQYLENDYYCNKSYLYKCDIDYVPIIKVNIGDELVKYSIFDEEKIEESGMFHCLILFDNNRVMCSLNPISSQSYPNASYNYIYQFSSMLEVESIYYKEVVEYKNGDDIEIYNYTCNIMKSAGGTISLHEGEDFLPTSEFLYEINF